MPRTRIIAGVALLIALGALAIVTFVQRRDDKNTTEIAAAPPPFTTTSAAPAPSTTRPSTTTTPPTTPHDPQKSFNLTQVHTVTGAISPKSVAPTGTGLVFAQNMMYRH